MLKSNPQAKGKSKKEKGKSRMRMMIFAFCLLPFAFVTACRYDMQDQPRYKAFKKSEFFNDKRAMRDLPEGTVARGQLREDKAFYQGKIEGAAENTAQPTTAQTTSDASGSTAPTTFPGMVTEFPVPVTKELLDRGEERYKIFCSVCHGPLGGGDGMVVRRGFPQPPSYHDDRLRNAPVGYFYDVITNGFGKMNPYASQIPPADRWAIVAYIRALQISQNPNGMNSLPRTTSNTNTVTTTTNNANNANSNTATTPANTAVPQGGNR